MNIYLKCLPVTKLQNFGLYQVLEYLQTTSGMFQVIEFDPIGHQSKKLLPHNPDF